MKFCILFLLCLAASSISYGATIADGSGYFPILVVITNEEGLPIRGVTVELEDSGRIDPKNIPDPKMKLWMERVGLPVVTDDRGAAVLFYYGGYSIRTQNDATNYTRTIRGTVVVNAPGFERVRQTVPEVVGGKTTSHPATWAPLVQIVLKRKHAEK